MPWVSQRVNGSTSQRVNEFFLVICRWGGDCFLGVGGLLVVGEGGF